MEEVRAKARHLLTDTSLPGVNEIQTAQAALEKDWHTLAETLDSVKEKTQSSKRLIQGYLLTSILQICKSDQVFTGLRVH